MANEGFKKVFNGKYYIGYGYIIEKDPRYGWTTYNIFKEEDVKNNLCSRGYLGAFFKNIESLHYLKDAKEFCINYAR